MKFYKNIILKSLQPMQKGYLHITLADGSTMELGNKSNQHHADGYVIEYAQDYTC